MGRAGYDDWNFMGEVQKEHRIKTKQGASVKNSFVLICLVCIFSLLGLVCVYSASFPIAVKCGLNHYYYLVNQCIYLAVGILLFVLVNIFPTTLIKIISPIFLLTCIGILFFDVILKKEILLSSDTVGFLFVSAVMYMSLYFSNRDNSITKLRQLVVPGLGCLIVLVLLMLQKNFSYALLFAGISAVMFIGGGVGVFGMIILVLYILVPVLAIILTKSNMLLSVARFFVPNTVSNEQIMQSSAIREAISSGAWFGKGLGMGEHKTGEIVDLAGKCVFANICEEVGFIGAIVLILMFIFLGFIGYRITKALRNQNNFYSNLSLGCTTILLWQAIINIAWLLDCIPGEGLSLPFFSYGLEIVPVMLCCGLIYKAACQKNSERAKAVETIQDELMFPEKYDFENV